MEEKGLSIYAPVIIPTVNRYNHFKECLESLSRCTWADKTDVFVAVDYPGKEEHWDGYRKIVEYLKHCGDLGFHSLNVTYREENYFYSGKGNASSLIRDISKTYNHYIFSEDDNVFSPNFLEYINKGLEKFEDDPQVVAICGYCHPTQFKCDGGAFAQSINYSAWGYATWIEKNNCFVKDLNKHFFKKVFYSPSKMYKIAQTGWGRVLNVIHNSTADYVTRADYNYSMLMLLNDKVMIMPQITKVKNMGWDSLSVHNNAVTPQLNERAHLEMSRTMDAETHFEYSGDVYAYKRDNDQIMITFGKQHRLNDSLYFKIVVIIKFLIRFILFWR